MYSHPREKRHVPLTRCSEQVWGFIGQVWGDNVGLIYNIGTDAILIYSFLLGVDEEEEEFRVLIRGVTN